MSGLFLARSESWDVQIFGQAARSLCPPELGAFGVIDGEAGVDGTEAAGTEGVAGATGADGVDGAFGAAG